MAKEVNKKKKLEDLKANRNINLLGAAVGGGYGGYRGYKLGRDLAAMDQYGKFVSRVNELNEKLSRGEKATEVEAKFLQNPRDAQEKVLGLIFQSPKTKKGKIIGTVGGSLLSSSPFLLKAALNQHKINKLKKEIKKEEEERKSFSIKRFSKKSSDGEDFYEPTEEEVRKLTRNQVLGLIDKKDKQVDKNKKKLLKAYKRKGGLIGGLVGSLGGAGLGYLSNKLTGGSNKSALASSITSGIGLGVSGYLLGKKAGKNRAEDLIKTEKKYNNEKVTRDYAKDLDEMMRKQGREDDLSALNEERIQNKRTAERNLEDYVKSNSVLNLGRTVRLNKK